MSRELILNFIQWKIFYLKYKPIRVSLWLAYKITENNWGSRLFAELIQTWKKYPASFDKISTLTWRLLVISRQFFSFELCVSITSSLWNVYCRNLNSIYMQKSFCIFNKLQSSLAILLFPMIYLRMYYLLRVKWHRKTSRVVRNVV